MANTTFRRLCITATFLGIGFPTFAADVIRLAQPRPLMILTGELSERYGYRVTYEDAPADPTREIVIDKDPNGPTRRYPAWKPVVFHLQTREDSKAALAGAVPAPGIIEPLLDEYNSSGNPGRFNVVYDGDYAHVVQTQRSVDGKLVDFDPILGTVVPVTKAVGICGDVLDGLWSELRQARGIKDVMEAAVPMAPLHTQQCIITGHDIPARQVLNQILDQFNVHPRTGERLARYVWTFVHDPTIDSYFLGVRMVSSPPPVTPAKGL